MKMLLKQGVAFIASILLFEINGFNVESIDGDTWISESAKEYCYEIGQEYGICPEFLMAIIERESWGEPKVQNGSCKGLMQVSEKWHKDRMNRLGVTDLFDEYGNILVGTDYLLELFKKYEDPAVVLGVYHGESDVIERASYGTISEYVQEILERSIYLEEYHEIYQGGVG